MRGGGLDLIYQDSCQISPHRHQKIQTSFEFQLVNICSPGRDFVLANIYLPPFASRSTFLVEFANLVTTLGIDAVNRLIICGDFNLPGIWRNSPNTIDDVCNVTDTISWWGHHDRVMQLSWLYFCGICQMMPLKVWPNTALSCNHQSICMPQLQPLCSAALVPNVLPRRDEGLGKPCAVIEAL